MREHLRAGAAVYNAGRYHAAHDAWEEYWLDLESGTDDERLLHGLIQFTAVVHHAREENWSGARGLAESAGEYLTGLPDTYRGVGLAPVRAFLAEMADDPEAIEDAPVPPLTHDGEAVTYDDLDFEATATAARVLAEAGGYDEGAIDGGIEYAREEVAAQGDGRFTGLLFAFVREEERRPIVAQRLGEHVDRRRHRDSDVDGLFEEREGRTE